MSFDWADLTSVLDPWAMGLAFMLGVVLGFGLVRSGHRPNVDLLLLTGLVFFVPLAIFRGLEGAPAWERLLGTALTFVVFAVGKALGSRLA